MFDKYDAYKDSSVQWIGQIPSGWPIEKAKWIFSRAERPVRKEDKIVTCFRDGEVTLRSNRRTEGFTNALKEHGYQGIRKGDLVIHAMDAFAGAIGVSDSDGKSTPVYSACIPRIKNRVNVYYYSYYLRNLALAGFIESLAKGIRERSTDFRFSDFAELLLPFPALEDQNQIVEFLNQKTSEIDQAIAIKEQQIALLNERKQIVIQKAVTQGLNPHVAMKDSGVEWIGEIPEHWEIVKLKCIVKYFKGNAFKSEDFVDDGIAIVKASNIKKYQIENITSFIALDNQKKDFERFRLRAGDIVVSTVGSKPEITESAVGQLGYISKDFENSYLNQNTVCFRVMKKVSSEFLKYVFLSKYMRNEFDRRCLWIANQAYLEVDEILNISICFPSIEEQNNIVSSINETLLKVNKVQELLTEEIIRLKEYKTTLINDAITGKIKVV